MIQVLKIILGIEIVLGILWEWHNQNPGLIIEASHAPDSVAAFAACFFRERILR